MGKLESVWQHLTEGAELPGESSPGQSLVELLGDGRVLVENHRGVREYSREEIGVRVPLGQIQICGCDLELIQMTREQLIIGGQIHQITVHRRG